jgi:hypothetical protein
MSAQPRVYEYLQVDARPNLAVTFDDCKFIDATRVRPGAGGASLAQNGVQHNNFL